MIRMPHRSITRFFIPMIDVLTLLFCIYLLMPMVSDAGGETDAARQVRERRLRALEEELARRSRAGEQLPEDVRKLFEQFQRERAKGLRQRLNVRVLEVNAESGRLYYRGLDGRPIEIRNEAEAAELIRRDQEITGAEKRELYYLVLYPRDPRSGYPTVGQKQDYDRWFREAAMGYDKPGLDLGRQPK